MDWQTVWNHVTFVYGIRSMRVDWISSGSCFQFNRVLTRWCHNGFISIFCSVHFCTFHFSFCVALCRLASISTMARVWYDLRLGKRGGTPATAGVAPTKYSTPMRAHSSTIAQVSSATDAINKMSLLLVH
jgi:hypothetical protein